MVWVSQFAMDRILHRPSYVFPYRSVPFADALWCRRLHCGSHTAHQSVLSRSPPGPFLSRRLLPGSRLFSWWKVNGYCRHHFLISGPYVFPRNAFNLGCRSPAHTEESFLPRPAVSCTTPRNPFSLPLSFVARDVNFVPLRDPRGSPLRTRRSLPPFFPLPYSLAPRFYCGSATVILT